MGNNICLYNYIYIYIMQYIIIYKYNQGYIYIYKFTSHCILANIGAVYYYVHMSWIQQSLGEYNYVHLWIYTDWTPSDITYGTLRLFG